MHLHAHVLCHKSTLRPQTGNNSQTCLWWDHTMVGPSLTLANFMKLFQKGTMIHASPWCCYMVSLSLGRISIPWMIRPPFHHSRFTSDALTSISLSQPPSQKNAPSPISNQTSPLSFGCLSLPSSRASWNQTRFGGWIMPSGRPSRNCRPRLRRGKHSLYSLDKQFAR